MKEHYYEKLLNIHTKGKGSYYDRSFYHPYEPTPYYALETLFQHLEVDREDVVVDFGCGKGRLNFYLHYFYEIEVTGVEMNPNFYQEAIANVHRYQKVQKRNLELLHFYQGIAEDYPIRLKENRFYFFNPFSWEIFIKVINNILKSYEIHPREIKIILYYPSEDYIYFLEENTIFEQEQEILVPSIYHNDNNERFLVYSV